MPGFNHANASHDSFYACTRMHFFHTHKHTALSEPPLVLVQGD